jgi:hypothetical protein
MENMLRQWCALVPWPLRQSLAQRPWDPPPTSGYEVAQLARDGWCLYGDIAIHRLLSGTLVRTQKGWSHR